ncbi:MAG: CDP-alcohol phosphatidyltransferase family protein [Chloroflexota bacterium]
MERLRTPAGRVIAPLVSLLIRCGVTADSITIAGCVGSCAVGVVIALGQLSAAGVAFLLVSALDMFDGAVARATGTVRPFGAFLDSVLDRFAEAAIFAGLVYYYAGQTRPIEASVAALALIGSFGVSYARARAEGLGIDCSIGWFQRPERVVLTGAGLILHEYLLFPAIILLAALTFITVWQRAVHVAGQLGEHS